MKLLVFTDIHTSTKAFVRLQKNIAKWKPDLLLCCGDFTVFGHDLHKTLKKLAGLKKPLLLIPGNHEDIKETRNACKMYKNIINIHGKQHKVGDVLFLGWGGGGFALVDREFELKAKQWENAVRKAAKVVLVTHGPPYNTNLDKIVGESCGCKSIAKFIKKFKNKLTYAFSGHLHENFNKEDQIGTCRLLNPGPYGKLIEL